MTRFWRDGHWRSGRYGIHWVEGHWVDRDDWGGGYYSPPPPQPRPSSSPPPSIIPRAPQGFRASFTIPNATCPVCGARVFFYQNEFGSRVFFDDLGPPWPKHPCTDNTPAATPRSSRDFKPAGPPVRTAVAPSEPALPLIEAHPVDNYVGSIRSGDGWDRCVVKKRSIRDEVAYFVVFNESDEANKSIRFSTIWRADLPTTGETLYLKDRHMSFFSFEAFEPCQIEIELKASKAVSSVRKRRNRKKRRRK